MYKAVSSFVKQLLHSTRKAGVNRPHSVCAVTSGLFFVLPSYLLQQLLDLLPVLSLTIIDDVVSAPTMLNYLPQAWVFSLQVFLWENQLDL